MGNASSLLKSIVRVLNRAMGKVKAVQTKPDRNYESLIIGTFFKRTLIHGYHENEKFQFSMCYSGKHTFLKRNF